MSRTRKNRPKVELLSRLERFKYFRNRIYHSKDCPNCSGTGKLPSEAIAAPKTDQPFTVNQLIVLNKDEFNYLMYYAEQFIKICPTEHAQKALLNAPRPPKLSRPR